MTLTDHHAADAARDAIDRLSDERDAALADSRERQEALICVLLERNSARAELARTRRFLDAAWPIVEDQS